MVSACEDERGGYFTYGKTSEEPAMKRTATMKAVYLDDFGPAEVLRFGELPRPTPAKGEVLIRVRAAGVNPVDWKIREGLLKTRLPHQFPIIPGWDVAGVVAEVGPGVRGFQKGDAVYAYARKPVIQDGCYAEYVALPARQVALKPRNLSFEEAAAIPLAALTAWQSLFDAAELKKGQTVLVHAAAGGVGGFAVQLAKNSGATVVGTARAENHEYLRELGADIAVDYTAGDFVAAIRERFPRGVDVVLDAVGGETQTRSAELVRRGGTLVTILAPEAATEAALRRRGANLRYVFVTPNAAQLRKLTALAEAGRLRVHLADMLPLSEAAEAQRRVQTGHTRGKIVLRVA